MFMLFIQNESFHWVIEWYIDVHMLLSNNKYR
jgi:hypothetical protein